MRWIVLAFALLAVCGGLVAFIGSRVPQAHVASRRATFPAPPETIWRFLTDVDAFPTWRSKVKKVTRLSPDAGRPRWVEEGGNGRITYVFERVEQPRLLVTRIADADLAFGGSWTFEIAPVPDGTAVSITESGEIYNPIFRFMARFVFGYEATMAQYLADLQRVTTSQPR